MFGARSRMFGMGRRHGYGWGRQGFFGSRHGSAHGRTGPILGGGALPIVGYLLWRNRDRIGSWFDRMRQQRAEHRGGSYEASRYADANPPPGPSPH